jgi:amino acid transporter
MIAEILAITELFKFRVDKKWLEELPEPYPNTDGLYWWRSSASDPSPAIWVTLALLFILGVNMLPAKRYGQMDYIVGCIKITFLVALIMINTIANDQADPFRYYRAPYGFGKTTMTVRYDAEPPVVYEGSKATFAAFWTGLSVCFFSLLGWDVILVTAPENKDLSREETVKLSGRKLGLRVVLLYCLAVFTAGLNVPSDDSPLKSLSISGVLAGQNSIFVLAAIRSGIPFFPHFLNGFFIFSAFFTGCNALYCSGRLLHAIACRHDAWPEWKMAQSLKSRLERTQWGVPTNAIITSWLVGFLAYMSVGKPEEGDPHRSATTDVSLFHRRFGLLPCPMVF